MILGNHFSPNPHVWQQQKISFSGNSLPVDRNLRLWPGNDFTLSFSLQIISGSRKTQREREKERRESERKNNTKRVRERTQREQEKEQHTESENQNTPSDLANEWEKEPTLWSNHRELRSSQRARERTRAPIQPPTPIYLTPVTSSSARRSPRQTPQTHGEWELKLTPIQTNAPDPAQPVNHRSSHSDHRAKHRLTVSFPEPVHRPHTHLTSDPHTSDPHTHLTGPAHPPDPPLDPISALYIYICIYLFI